MKGWLEGRPLADNRACPCLELPLGLSCPLQDTENAQEHFVIMALGRIPEGLPALHPGHWSDVTFAKVERYPRGLLLTAFL